MNLRVLLVPLASLSLPLSAAAEASYARPELLVEAADLAKPGVALGFVVLDSRPRRQFEEARIPGSRWVDHDAWAKEFGDGKDAALWSKRIGGLGIGAATRVVVYDDSASKEAGRIWWILRYWGVSDARLLNGGWRAWKAGSLPVEGGAAAPPVAVELKASPREETLATKDLILRSLKDSMLQIVDARSEAEHCGTEKLRNKRGGAIPGSKLLDWVDLIDAKSARFKPAKELADLFAAAGIDLKKPSAAHCQSGGRASVMVFALELMGAKEARNYYRSWAEWSSAEDTPVVPGTPRTTSKPKE